MTIAANTTYVAGYLAPSGHYSAASAAFGTAGVNNPPLHALANSVSANGVYAYSATSTFPTNTFNATNYYVDVTFTPTPTVSEPPGAPTGVSATPATGQALVSWIAPANTGGNAITGYTVTPYAGGVAQTPLQESASTTSLDLTGLARGTSYTFTVKAKNAIGTGPASSTSNAVTPQDTIFDFATPATIDSSDTSATEVGVKFSSTVSGTVTGIRFYKAATNTGTHIGSLWTASGTLLAQATFTNETTAGWQQVNFSSPVTILPGTTYVAAYLAPTGHYSATSAAFVTAGVENGPLQALANGVSADGVYAYSAASTFPTNTYNATNYFVDVTFTPGSEAPGAPTAVTAAAATGQALVSWTAPASNGGSPVTGYTVTPYVGGTAQTPTQVGASASTATITGLTTGANYTFTVKASNAIGTGPASSTSNTVTPQDTIFDFATPSIVDAGDPSSVELGVKFDATVNGSVTGIRFYKAATNTGTHIGSLWSASGELLAQATFANETTAGWQQVSFSSPITILPGTTYVAAYLAPSGHYSATSAAFGTGVENGPLQALANGISADGVYSYSATSTFPINTYNATNYYVDVTFTPES